MIEAALEWLKENTQPDFDVIEVSGRNYLRNPNDWTEVRADTSLVRAFVDEHSRALQLGTLDSLISFVAAHADLPCQIVVSSDGTKAFFNIHESFPVRDMGSSLLWVWVPFHLPPEKLEFSVAKFWDFLDQKKGHITEYDAVAQAVKEIRRTDVTQLVIKESGPIINVATASKKDIEGSSVDIPKELTIAMEVGTREFLILTKYLLRINTTERGVGIVLTHKELDGSWEALVAAAFDKLKIALPNVLVLEGTR